MPLVVRLAVEAVALVVLVLLPTVIGPRVLVVGAILYLMRRPTPRSPLKLGTIDLPTESVVRAGDPDHGLAGGGRILRVDEVCVQPLGAIERQHADVAVPGSDDRVSHS